MRGRTNVGGGNGIFVNGDIDFYTITEGNSITAGDFVSRKIIPQIQSVYNNSITIRGGDKISDDMYLFLINNYLTLFRYNGTNISIVRTYTTYTTEDYAYDPETGRIWGVVYSDTGYNIVQFEIQNEKIVFINKYEENIGDRSTYCYYAKENIFYRVYGVGSSVGYGYTDIIIEKYMISENNSIERASETIRKEGIGNSRSLAVKRKIGNKIYFTISSTWGREQDTKSYYERMGVLSISDTSVFDILYSYSFGYKVGNLTTSTVVEKNNKCIFLASAEKGKEKLIIVDLETNTHAEFGLINILSTMSDLGYGYYELSDFLTESLFLLKKNEKCFLLEYNQDTGQIQQYSNMVEIKDFYVNGAFLNQGNDIILLGINGKTIKFEFDGTMLLSGEDQKIIQPYDKDIGSIGLAKNSGKAGDSIAVYVPR